MEAVTDAFILTTPEDANDMLMARNIGEALEKAYPNWGWAVTIDRGVVNIFAMRLSGQWGFTMLASQVSGDMRNVVMGGGELLERYKAHRGRCTRDRLESSLIFPETAGLPGGRTR